MSKTFKIAGYRGMNNIQESSSRLANREGNICPEIILNAHTSQDGALIKRDGFIKAIALSSPRSLWSGSVMLCVVDDKLCKVEGSNVMEICNITGDPSYVEINNLIFVSTKFFTGIYEPALNVMRSWGIPLPPAPRISVTSGELPPGRYCVCYTKVGNGSQISGSSQIVEIEWTGQESGIKLIDQPENTLVWVTDTNGTDFFLATVSGGKISSPHYNKPLPSLFCTPPPHMSIIRHAHGRIWGVVGKKLYYSEANSYEWWKEENSFTFIEELVMIAPVQDGIYVASRNTTWILKGTDPQSMTLAISGDGMVPGSVVYDEFQQSGQEVPFWKHKSVLPVWMSTRGFVIGNDHLYLANLTEGNVNIPLGKTGASLSRRVDGQTQIIVSMPCHTDSNVGDAFKIGRIFSPE